eukprot:TRINITY_DN7729_c0_g1_i3.p1 TRINITY_DN7729_c0_g1~~TRINITY_DN7729_c0_g1_i3.p1  ORF type:complete len:232 (-),score=36.06 TRINITY_DN7729_c0_g1_i3:79-774(-)
MPRSHWSRPWLLLLVESWIACGEVATAEECQDVLEAPPIWTSMLQLDVNMSDTLARLHEDAAKDGTIASTQPSTAQQIRHPPTAQQSSEVPLSAIDASASQKQLHAATAKAATTASTQPSTAQQIRHPPKAQQSSKVLLSAIDASVSQKQKSKFLGGTLSLIINCTVLFLVVAFALLLWHNNGNVSETVQEVRNNPKHLVSQFEDGQAQDSLRQIGSQTGITERRTPLSCC